MAEEKDLTVVNDTAVSELNEKELKTHNAKRKFKTVFNIVAAAFLRAVALELLLIPNHVIIGGAVGVAGLLSWVIPGAGNLAGVFLLAVNIPLLIIAFVKTDKGFAIKTAICVVLMTAMMEVLAVTGVAQIIHTSPATGEDMVLFTLLGGALNGLSLPLMLSIQASTGGSDIVTMVMQRHGQRENYFRVILCIDIATIVIAAIVSQICGVALESGVSIDIWLYVLVYSIAAQFTAHVVQNQIYKGYSSAFGFDIITDKPKEVADALSANLHRGLTGIKVTGMYSHKDKTMIVCIIYKRQLNRARQIVRQADPNAFATVYTVKEVVGNGFRNTDEDIQSKVLHDNQKETKKR